MSGEEASPELFNYVISVLEELVDDVPARQFALLATQVSVLSYLGYVDLNRIPESVRLTTPQESGEKYSDSLAGMVEQLYTKAVSASHL